MNDTDDLNELNDLVPLRRLGQEVPLPDRAALAPARARLLDELDAPAGPARRALRSPWLPRLAGGLSVGVAAAVVAAVAVVLTGSGGSEPVPIADPPAAAGTPSGVPAPGVPDARTVLRLAATAALAQPFTEPRADQFLYLETVYDGHTRQDWLSMDGTHDGLVATMGADPGVPVPGCRDGRRAVVRGTTVGPGTEPCEPDPAYLPDLPTDATAMGLHLRAMGGHPGTNSWAKNAAELGLHHYLRPAARAALYQAAAEIDGVTVVPGVTDGAGRPGTGIRWTHGGTGPGVTMVFDPTTHLFLGFQDGDALVKAVVVDAVGDTA